MAMNIVFEGPKGCLLEAGLVGQAEAEEHPDRVWGMRLLVSLLGAPHGLLLDTLEGAGQLGLFVEKEVGELLFARTLLFLVDIALPQLGETSDHQVSDLTGLAACDGEHVAGDAIGEHLLACHPIVAQGEEQPCCVSLNLVVFNDTERAEEVHHTLLEEQGSALGLQGEMHQSERADNFQALFLLRVHAQAHDRVDHVHSEELFVKDRMVGQERDRKDGVRTNRHRVLGIHQLQDEGEETHLDDTLEHVAVVGNQSRQVRHLLKLSLLYLVQVEALIDLADVGLVADLCPVLIVHDQVADDLEGLEGVLLVRRRQHHLEDFVEEERVDQVLAFGEPVSCLDGQMSYHEAPIVFEGRVEEVVQRLLNGPHSECLGLLDSLHVCQPFQPVEVVFIVQDLVVAHGLVQSTDQEAQVLACVHAQRLRPLLLILLALVDFGTLLVKLTQLLFVLCPFHLVDLELVVDDRSLDRSNHLLFFRSEDFSDLLRDQFFLLRGLCEAACWP